jgi:hypothetical protein
MDRLDALRSVAGQRHQRQRSERPEHAGAGAASAVDERRLEDDGVAMRRAQVIVGGALAAVEAARRVLVRSERGHLHDAHAFARAGLEQRDRRTHVDIVHRVVARRREYADRIHDDIDAADVRNPPVRVDVAAKVDVGAPPPRHAMPGRLEGVRGVAADEAARAGDQDVHWAAAPRPA